MSIERMSRVCGVENEFRTHIRRIEKASKSGSSKSLNSRASTKSNRRKFGIKVLISTKKRVTVCENGDNKWCKAIHKELIALEKLNTWISHPTHHKIPKEHQKEPL